MIQYLLIIGVLLPAASAYGNVCKREVDTVSGEWGFDKCDENGLACCYYIKTNGTHDVQTIIIYSHNFNNGAYIPNTHCRYEIEIDVDCEIAACFAMGFGLEDGDMIRINNKDIKMDIRKSKKGVAPSNFVIPSNKVQIDFESTSDEKPDTAKWALGLTCKPKHEYKSICEMCEDIKEQIENGPDKDEDVVKFVS